MKKKNFKVITVLLICSYILFSLYITPLSMGDSKEITPAFGDTPNRNGKIDTDEWDATTFTEIRLKTTPSDDGLEVFFKAIQDKNDLYILIQFEVDGGSQESSGFLAILISNTNSYDEYDFVDAKIVNITSNTIYSYKDYNINYTNNNFTLDQEKHGDGAGTIEEIEGEIKQVTYEFCILLDQDEDEDAYLEYKNSYKFNISQGDDPSNHPKGIIRSTSLTINVREPEPPQLINMEAIIIATSITIFSINGIFFAFYVYRIVLLKKKIKRIR